MSKFKVGDRVVLNQDYDKIDKGTAGVVTSIDPKNHVFDDTLVHVTFDGGGRTSVFDSRLDREQPKTRYEYVVGDKGLTRDGTPYEVLALLPDGGDYPLVVSLNGNRVKTYTTTGSRCVGEVCDDFDLLPPKRAKVVYLNVYDNVVWGYSSAGAARNAADVRDALLVAHKVVIELP